ncbi:MAG TPA: bifunctional diguanylate cyclase/phosphodiesterase, partial [Epsilonproteobacteria bacterium]|nr:bifunctional diguanylate cyclase/phosphodiesterase [Campylobacterota bacterium]
MGAMAAIKNKFEVLNAADVLHRTQYKKTRKRLQALKIHLLSYEEMLDDYLMLNAGIKNSFVFLTSLSAEKNSVFEDDPQASILLLSIIADVSRSRMLADASFLEGIESKALPLGRLKELNKAQASFVRSFLVHLHFIASNYPQFIKTLSEIEHSDIEKGLEAAEEAFLNDAKTDFAFLERVFFILLLLLLTAIVMISILLIRMGVENRRLRTLKMQLRHSLSHDLLTGLYSRKQFEEVQGTFEQPTLILININHFKHVNDFYGSAVGNAILTEMALLIRQPILEAYSPEYFRLGGDDFGVVIHAVEAERAMQLATTLKKTIESYIFVVDEIDIYITVSAVINRHVPLLENADLLLKQAKGRYRDTIAVYSDHLELKENARMNIDVTREVKEALESKGIIAWFQPIVDLQSGKTVKFEALARMKTADGTVKGPAQFLSVAKKTPYYYRITRMMIQHVFEAMQDTSYYFSVNIGMRDLEDEKLMDVLRETLTQNSHFAHRLEIELLESEELDDLRLVRTLIEELKALGCTIAIDDFGSGYSNFSYIMNLNADVLKIDGSLISTMLENEISYQTVKTIADFAKNMGLAVVGEFVATKETAAALKKMGICCGQGYYFAKPSERLSEPDITP